MTVGEASDGQRSRIFIVTAPGVERIAANEMADLGIPATVEDGGLSANATREQLYVANLQLRSASRVLVRIAEFRARTFFELERHARRVDWNAYLGSGRPVRLRVTSRKSRLYHQRAIEERLLEAIEITATGASRERRTSARKGSPPLREVDTGANEGNAASPARGRGADPGTMGAAIAEDELEGMDEQLFIVRFLHDRCTISVDASGALLHLRGYRQAVARAPLRETLAAALLLASGWDRATPLVDPLCGSGTIPIEAALMARRIAPGLAIADRRPRRYAFESWPDYDAGLWQRMVNEAREAILTSAAGPIIGSDRDAGAIAAASANAARAGVADDVELTVRAMSSLPEIDGAAWLVTNPPYGVRVGESEGLRDLYAALGSTARRSLPDGTLAMLSADRRLERHTRLPLQEVLSTRNGGIEVRVVSCEV